MLIYNPAELKLLIGESRLDNWRGAGLKTEYTSSKKMSDIILSKYV
jgi:hypothetical protein